MEPARSTWHAFSFSSVTLDLSVLHTPAVKAIELPAGTLCQDLLRDGQLLHIGGAFIDPADFGVAIQLLHWIILGEAYAAEDFHRLRGSVLGHLRREVLRHGRFGDVGASGIAQPG